MCRPWVHGRLMETLRARRCPGSGTWDRQRAPAVSPGSSCSQGLVSRFCLRLAFLSNFLCGYSLDSCQKELMSHGQQQIFQIIQPLYSHFQVIPQLERLMAIPSPTHRDRDRAEGFLPMHVTLVNRQTRQFPKEPPTPTQRK